YYPGHAIDANGIGPGNLTKVLERGDDGAWRASSSRIEATLEEFHARDEETLLLSSEFFATQIGSLSQRMPSGTRFIVYVRDPIGHRASNYNQGIKRAGFTQPFRTQGVGKNGEVLLPFLKDVPALLDDGV